MRGLRLLLLLLPPSIANLIEFFPVGDTSCSGTASTRSWVFTDLCTSYLGAYGLALSACGADGAGPLTVSLFFSASGARPPLCTGGGAYALFSAPARGLCAPTSGTAAQFAGSFRIGSDAAPPTCASSAAQSAFHLAADASGSCASPPTSYLTAPLRSGACAPASVLGYYASRAAAARPPDGVALTVLPGAPTDACASGGGAVAPVAEWAAPPLALDGACAAAPGSAWVAAALPAAPYSPAPAPPPPALPGTGAAVQVYYNATDCSGPSFYLLAAYPGVCSAFVGLGIALGPCAPGASATIRIYNDSAASPQSRAAAPPACAAGGSVNVFEATLALGQCTQLLASPEGGRVYGRLLSARCAPPPSADSVLLAATWTASAACATPAVGGGAGEGPIWSTLEATLPCAQYNWLGTWQNSSVDLETARGVVSQTVHYSLGAAEGCGGPELYVFKDVPLDGSACVASSAAAIGSPVGMRVVRPGGALPSPPPRSGTASDSPTVSQPPLQSPSQTPLQSPSQTPLQSPSQTPLQSPSQTPLQSPSPTPSQTPSPLPTPSQSLPPSPPPSPPPTPPPTPPATPTPSPTLSPGASPSASPSPSRTPTPTPSPPATPSPPPAAPSGSAAASASPAPPPPPPPAQQAQQAAAPGALTPGAAAGVSLGVLAGVAGLAGAVWWGGGCRAWRGGASAAAGKATAPELRRARAAMTDERGGGAVRHPVLDKAGGAGGSSGEVVQSPLWRAV